MATIKEAMRVRGRSDKAKLLARNKLMVLSLSKREKELLTVRRKTKNYPRSKYKTHTCRVSNFNNNVAICFRKSSYRTDRSNEDNTIHEADFPDKMGNQRLQVSRLARGKG